MLESEALALIKASAKPHYLYILKKPDGTPFYVGVGTGRRILDHAIRARRPSETSHKLNTIRKIWLSGENVDYEIVGWFDNWHDAAAAEVEEIAKYGRRDLSQ